MSRAGRPGEFAGEQPGGRPGEPAGDQDGDQPNGRGGGRRRGFSRASGGNTYNTTEGDTHIGVQAGVIHGDVSYMVSGGDSPEKKFAVAKNYIAGGRLRSAEELIREVVAGGFVSAERPSSLANEVAYHWAIAVLGDRSFELLDREQFDQLAQARELVRRGPRDQWQRAHEVITDLVGCLLEQEESRTLAPERLDAFFARFYRLDRVHREEIRRHLDLILSGAFQDRLSAHDLRTARTERTGNGREGRVWKFFEPDPAKPRVVPVHWPDLNLFQKTMTVWAALMGPSGLIIALILLIKADWRTTLLSALLIILCGTVVGRVGPGMLPARYAPSPTRDPKAARRRASRPEHRRFADHVNKTVQRQFDKRAPKAPLRRSAWAVATRRARTTLAHEVIEVYADTGISPDRVDWLIAWHAEGARRRWVEGDVRDLDPVLRVLALIGGIVGLVIGVYLALPKMEETQPTVAGVAVLWIAGGLILFVAGRADVRLVGRYTHRTWVTAARVRLAAETEAYERRRDLLADRPSDAEMVRWLDFDKFHLKTLAMNQYGLGNRDVIAHAFLAEAAPQRRRARISNGPPRFSAYTVWVFLLTPSGVRIMTVHLDFPTGIMKDQQRMAFRYDAFAAARVNEHGVRFDDGRRENLLPWLGALGNARKDGGRPDKAAFVFFQVFQLSLVSGQRFAIEVENLEPWLVQQGQADEDPSPAAVPDSADLSGAFGILEAVAADGSEWIAQARTRRRRRPPIGPGNPGGQDGAGDAGGSDGPGRAGPSGDGHPDGPPFGPYAPRHSPAFRDGGAADGPNEDRRDH